MAGILVGGGSMSLVRLLYRFSMLADYVPGFRAPFCATLFVVHLLMSLVVGTTAFSRWRASVSAINKPTRHAP